MTDEPALRVVEYAQDSIAASFAARLLGELGAHVVKVELAGHPDALRRRPPAPHGESVPFSYTSRHKRFQVVPDLDMLRGLAADADVLLVASVPDAGTLRARSVTIAISPFGGTGPRASWQSGSLGLFHAGGVGYVTPRSAQTGSGGEIAPEAPGGYLVEYFCGLYAALGALAFGTGGGRRFVDLSMQDCLLPLTRREVGAWLTQGRVPSRNQRLWRVGPSGFYPCADGHVYVSVIEDAQWRRLVELTGWPGTPPPELATAEQRFDRPDFVDQVIGPWLRSHTGSEVYELTGRAGIPVGPVFSPADLAGQPFLRTHDDLTQVTTTGGTLTLPKPLPDGVRVGHRWSGPLAGARVVEFAHVWAGPLCGQYLADLGAEVIRVESREYLDVHRRAGPYVGGEPDINGSTVWRAQNRGKRGCTINLKSTEGRDLARRLVATADLVIENYRPGTMDRLGLGYERLREVQPRLTMLSLSGYGQHGERSQFPAYGPMMDAVSGLSWSTRDDAGTPHSVNGWFPDVAGALYGAVLGAASLRGAVAPGHVDVSELRSLLSLLPEMIAVAGDPESTAAVRANHTYGGRHCVPLRCRGDDEWIAVESDGNDDDTDAARLRSVVIELSEQDTDSTVTVRQLARAIDRDRLCAALQAVGVAAVPVLSARDLIDDEHLTTRRSFLGDGDPVTTMYAPVWLVDGTRAPAGRPAPELGRDNDYVFGVLLGLGEDTIRGLAESGALAVN